MKIWLLVAGPSIPILRINPGWLIFVVSKRLIYTLSYKSLMFDQISLFSSTTLFDNKYLQSVDEKNFFSVCRFDKEYHIVQN